MRKKVQYMVVVFCFLFPFIMNAQTLDPLTSATSNDVLTGWNASYAIDGNAGTAYSSNSFTSSTNDRGTYWAAWFSTGSVKLDQVLLTARIYNGAICGFPKAYDIYVTDAGNTQWVNVGNWQNQPAPSNGIATVNLDLSWKTWGILIKPTTLGTDNNGGYYFQMAEISATTFPACALPTTNTLSSSQVGTWTTSLTTVSFPSMPFFYSSNIIDDNGVYKMWATVADQVRYYTSTDGANWSGGQVVLKADPGTWEDDGNYYPPAGQDGGISDPRVVKGITPGWAYTMYYTAGPDPNTTIRGGMGVAFSNDGINWAKWGGNPIRRFPGGHTFATQNFIINGVHYLYFYGGGDAQNGPPLRVAKDISIGVNFSEDTTLSLPGTSYPIFYDSNTQSFWLANHVYQSCITSGPVETDIYGGSNGINTMGTQIGAITSSITGKISNFDVAAKEVSTGMNWLKGNTVQLIFPSGNTWAGWLPASVILSRNLSKISADEKTGNNQTPTSFSLFQNYPNPFNPVTAIDYSIEKREIVTLKVYNMLGQEVATLVNQEKDPGNYTVSFDASNLASGVYVYRIWESNLSGQSGNIYLTRKMTLLK